jgi:hypothetical protein
VVAALCGVPAGVVAIWSQFRAVVARPGVWQRAWSEVYRTPSEIPEHQIRNLVL